MRIAPEHVQEKSVVGTTKDGASILYVLTKGGLHAFFARQGDDVVTLGAAPHRAVAEWIAEKKHPGIKWSEKSLERSEQDMFDRVRKLIFSTNVVENPTLKDRDLFFAYNPSKRLIDVVDRSELVEMMAKGEHLDSFVRPVNLSEPVDVARWHPDFREAVRGR